MNTIQTHTDSTNNQIQHQSPSQNDNLITDIEIGETPRTAQISSFVAYTKKLQFMGKPKTLQGLNCQGLKKQTTPDIGPKSAYLREILKLQSEPNEEFLSSSEEEDSNAKKEKNEKNDQQLINLQLTKASQKKRMTMGKNTRMDNQFSKAVFAEKDEREAMDKGSPHPRICSPENIRLSPINSKKLIGIESQLKVSSFKTNKDDQSPNKYQDYG